MKWNDLSNDAKSIIEWVEIHLQTKEKQLKLKLEKYFIENVQCIVEIIVSNLMSTFL